jgi:hypothetical protein
VTQPQHLQALDRANAIRLERAKAKRAIRAGDLSIAEALEMPYFQSATIFSVLRSQKRWGAYHGAKGTKALELLARVPVSPYRKVQDLTPRERGFIAGACSRKKLLAKPRLTSSHDPRWRREMNLSTEEAATLQRFAGGAQGTVSRVPKGSYALPSVVNQIAQTSVIVQGLVEKGLLEIQWSSGKQGDVLLTARGRSLLDGGDEG